jgi:peroxiredoxin
MMSSARPIVPRAAAILALTLAVLLGACAPPTALAPDFRYTLLDGTRAEGRDLRGQVVLINFWATTCAICIAEMPQLAAMHTRLRERGLTTLAVSMSYDPPARVAHFAESRGLPFGVVIDNTGEIARAFGDVRATPTTVVIDRRGQIVKRITGSPDFGALAKQLEELLAGGN